MQSDRLIQRLRIGVATVLAVQLASFFVQPSVAKALTPTPNKLIINEINWAGSASNSKDEWVELYNPTVSFIDLVSTPYTFDVNGSVEATLNTGVIAPHSYLLITRLNPADPLAHSSLASTVHSVVSPTLNLPNVDAQYTLKDTTSDYVDQANLMVGAPFAGSDGTGAASVIASQVRVASTTGFYTDGTTLGAWYSAETIGKHFAEDVVQYGTPSDDTDVALPEVANPVVPAPTLPSLVNSPGLVNNLPTVMATYTTPPVVAAAVRFVNHATGSAILGVGSIFTGYTPSTLLPAGTYDVYVAGTDAPLGGNLSPFVIVPTGTADNLLVVAPGSGTIQSPVLDAYPVLTNKASVTITGSVEAGLASVIVTNGAATPTPIELPMSSTTTTFSVLVPLTANTVNTIEVQAKAIDGTLSTPASAIVTEDDTAPSVIDATQVLVHANKAGTNDSVEGLAGATETKLGTVVLAYADADLKQLIGSTPASVDGSFPAISLGDNQYSRIYLVQRDAAGNLSLPISVENPISFQDENITLSIQVSNIGQNQATVSWLPVTGAVNYEVKFKTQAGDYGTPVKVCNDTDPVSSCTLSRTIIALNAGTNYTVAIAAIDNKGVISNYTTADFQTLAPVVVNNPAAIGGSPAKNVTAAAPVVSSHTSSQPVVETPAETTPTTEVTPTPTPTATPTTENGDVKSVQTSERNWTPWIILGVLIGLAILATAGYFYWFGGELEEETPAAVPSESKSTKETTTKAKKTDTPKEKRW